MIIMGKLFICASTTFLLYLGITYTNDINNFIYSDVFPVIKKISIY